VSRARLSRRSLYGKIQCLQSKSQFHRIPKIAITLQRIQGQEYRYILFLLSSEILLHTFQPFLTPLPPAERDLVATATLPLRYTLAIFRTALLLAIALFYVVAQLLSMIFVRYLSSELFCWLTSDSIPFHRYTGHSTILSRMLSVALPSSSLVFIGSPWNSLPENDRKSADTICT